MKTGIFALAIVLSLLAPLGAFATPCNSNSQEGAQPLSEEAVKSTLKDTMKAILYADKKGRFSVQVSVSGQGKIGGKPLNIVNLTQQIYSSLDNPSSPNYQQTQQDFNTAFNAYAQIINPTNPNTATVAQMQSFLTQYSKDDATTRLMLASLIAERAGYLYNNNISDMKMTSPQQILNALKNGTDTAGVCHDQAYFNAVVAKPLGLNFVGMTALDWSPAGGRAGGHAVLLFQDPNNPKMTDLNNYGSIYQIPGTGETVQNMAALALTPLPGGVAVESGSGSTPAAAKDFMFLPYRTAAVDSAITDASTSSSLARTNVDLSLGNISSTGSVETNVVGNPTTHEKLTVYALGYDYRGGSDGVAPGSDAFALGAAGVNENYGASKQLSTNVSLAGSTNINASVVKIADHSPLDGTSRDETQFFATSKNSLTVSDQKLSAGGTFNIIENFYPNVGHGGLNVGNPYDQVSGFVKYGKFTAETDGFIYAHQIESNVPTVHHTDDKFTYQDSVTKGANQFQWTGAVHALGGIGYGAYGFHAEGLYLHQFGDRGELYAGGDCSVQINHSDSPVLTQSPTCSFKGGASRTFSLGVLDVSGQYTPSDQYTSFLMNNDVPTDANPADRPGTAAASITITFGKH